MDIRIIQSTVLTEEQKEALTGSPVFDPDFLDAAIIGVTQNDDGDVIAVYSYELLVKCYADYYQAEHEAGEYPLDPEDKELGDEVFYRDAQEWVDYNTVTVVPYMGPRAPRIHYEFYEGSEE